MGFLKVPLQQDVAKERLAKHGSSMMGLSRHRTLLPQPYMGEAIFLMPGSDSDSTQSPSSDSLPSSRSSSKPSSLSSRSSMDSLDTLILSLDSPDFSQEQRERVRAYEHQFMVSSKSDIAPAELPDID